MMAKAIQIIQAEHRSLSALLTCFHSMVEDIEKGAAQPDFEIFHLILDYLNSFLYQMHHPKEDDYLYKALRQRHAEAEAIISELEEEHQQGKDFVQRLHDTILAYEKEGKEAFPAFQAAVDDYYQFEWDHMHKEENTVLPMAWKHLTAEDWETINAAFTAHEDPIFGAKPKAEFSRLLSVIAQLAPPPYGLGAKKAARPAE